MNFKRITALALSFVLMSQTVSFAEEVTTAEEKIQEKIKFIVELKEAPVIANAVNMGEGGLAAFSSSAEAKYRQDRLESEQRRVQSEIKEEIDENAETGFMYTYAFNGFSMEGTAEDMARIADMPEVKRVYEAKQYLALPDGGDVVNCCEEMAVDYMRENGITGKGQMIAVIDSGFDVNHEMFSGEVTDGTLTLDKLSDIISSSELSCGKNTDITAKRVYKSSKIPFAFNYASNNTDVYTENSHGTHVAGIAAGNNGKDVDGSSLKGAAPDAQLLMMCVKKENEKYFSDDAILAALDDAAKLGADVVNCSFGTSFEYSTEPEETAVINLREAGVAVFRSAGNMGRGSDENYKKDEDLYYGTDPLNIDYGSMGTGAFSGVTTVASSQTEKFREPYRAVVVDGSKLEYEDLSYYTSMKYRYGEKNLEYVYCKTGSDADIAAQDVSGKLVVIDMPEEIVDAAENAYAANAVGIAVINNKESRKLDNAIEYEGKAGIMLFSSADRDKLINAKNKSMYIEPLFSYRYIDNTVKGMSYFSSWSSMRDMELKPELTAPGGEIYSSIKDDGYENESGTSMSSPHAAGAAALLKQYMLGDPEKYGITDKKDYPVVMENLLMCTADMIYDDLDKGIPSSPRHQGSGLINLEKAAKTPVVLSSNSELDDNKPKLSLGITSDKFKLEFVMQNLTDSPVVYDKCEVKVMTDDVDEDGNIADMRMLYSTSDIPQSITLNANEKAVKTVNVTLDKSELEQNKQIFKNGFYIDGYIILGSSNAAVPSLDVPFSGFYGDWNAANVMDNNYYDKPVATGNRLVSTYLKDADKGKGIAVLGKNVFWTKALGDESDYNAERFAGISPNGDDYFDIVNVVFEPLRNAENIMIDIYDSNGQLITGTGSENQLQTTKKAKFQESEDSFDKVKLEEGDYYATITANYPGVNRAETSAPLKFYVDKQKPIFTKYEAYKEGDKSLIKVAAKDDRYIMAFRAEGQNADGEDIGIDVAVKGAPEAEAVLDVTNIAPETLHVMVFDYAFNGTIYGVKETIYGDSDVNDKIEANDAAVLLQKVLVSTYKMPIEEKSDLWMIYMDVDADAEITANDAVLVMQKALRSTFVFPIEKDDKEADDEE